MAKTEFYYKNHRGVTELRTVDVISLEYVATPHLEYGYGPGWFLRCKDFSRGRDGSEQRSFALNNIQMEGFKYDTKGGVQAFVLPLGTESVMDFLAWATTRPEQLVLSASDDAAPIVEAYKAYGKAKGWPD